MECAAYNVTATDPFRSSDTVHVTHYGKRRERCARVHCGQQPERQVTENTRTGAQYTIHRPDTLEAYTYQASDEGPARRQHTANDEDEGCYLPRGRRRRRSFPD